MIRQVGAGFVFTLVLISIACTASDTQMERWAEKFTQPAIEVTAVDLYRAFVRDDETAKQRYSGHRLRITGTVFEVREDDDFEPVVEFDVGQGEWSFESLVAQFAERHRTEVASWSKGRTMSVVCYIPVDEFSDLAFDSVTPLRMCQPL